MDLNENQELGMFPNPKIEAGFGRGCVTLNQLVLQENKP